MRIFTASIPATGRINPLPPLLLGSRSEHPAILLCDTSLLYWCRDDGAPHFLDQAPATSLAEQERYAAIAEEYERLTEGSAIERLNRVLRDLGLGPVSLPLFIEGLQVCAPATLATAAGEAR
jgi:hypothetical protein